MIAAANNGHKEVVALLLGKGANTAAAIPVRRNSH